MVKSIILSGPSGVGKTKIITCFLERNPNYVEPFSYHTRPRRDGDKPYYISISPEEFEERERKGEFYCISNFLQWRYACSKENIQDIKKDSRNLIMDYSLDNLNGILRLKNYFGAIFVYILPPNETCLSERLRERPEPDLVAERLRKAIEEVRLRQNNPNWQYIDFEIINSNLEDTLINLEKLALK